MGVNNLRRLIDCFATNAIQKSSIKQLEGVILTVDSSQQIYNNVFDIRRNNKGKDILTSDNKMINHILGIFNCLYYYITHNIRTVWVFDGRSPQIKQNTLKKRRAIRNNANNLLEIHNNTLNMVNMVNMVNLTNTNDDTLELRNKTFLLKREHKKDIQRLLTLLGIPYIESLGEAEIQCAAFIKAGRASAIISNDWDSLTLGIPYMIKTYSHNNNKIDIINLDILLKSLHITHDMFIDLCLLFGNDYIQGIGGVSPIFIYNKYMRFKNVRKLLDYFEYINRLYDTPKYIIPDDYYDLYTRVKHYYYNVNVIDPTDERIDLTWKYPDKDGLIQYLCNELEMDKTDVSFKIDKIIEIYNSQKN
jgi:flap endonuclease-1